MSSGVASAKRTEASIEARHGKRAPARRAKARTKMRMGSGVAPVEHAEASTKARHVERASARHAEARTEQEDGLQHSSGRARRGFGRGKACGKGTNKDCGGSIGAPLLFSDMRAW